MADPQRPAETDDIPGAIVQGVPSGPDSLLVLTPALRVGEAADTLPELLPTNAEDLRVLVRAILDDELRGAFGSRVTRGVRKLVRAEVALLLSARDCD